MAKTLSFLLLCLSLLLVGCPDPPQQTSAPPCDPEDSEGECYEAVEDGFVQDGDDDDDSAPVGDDDDNVPGDDDEETRIVSIADDAYVRVGCSAWYSGDSATVSSTGESFEIHDVNSRLELELADFASGNPLLPGAWSCTGSLWHISPTGTPPGSWTPPPGTTPVATIQADAYAEIGCSNGLGLNIQAAATCYSANFYVVGNQLHLFAPRCEIDSVLGSPAPLPPAVFEDTYSCAGAFYRVPSDD